ncbi:TrmB family transcriptional regulator [Candidatus Woesearchaeota archaeon]|nr:TrmB family transcriptional regulator [Candidatus Woesearchaeota archaeon]
MIVQKDFLSKLKDFGLNSYESKLWTALLSRGVSTAGELSDIANVPRSRSYDVLESLEKKGFIIVKLGKPIKYVAVPPEEVLERVKKKIKEDADISARMLDELRESDVLDELTLLHKQGIDLVDPTDISGSVKGRDSLYNHLDYMIKSAEVSITLITSTEGLLRKFEMFKPALKKAHKRGVAIRIVAPLTSEVLHITEELDGIAEIRHNENLPARFCVIDSKEVLFMLMDDKQVHPSYDAGVWVNTQFFATALEQLFELAWKDMKPLQQLKH